MIEYIVQGFRGLRTVPAKLTHEFVKGQFELAGYEMLGEYVNSSTKIAFRCPGNHLHSITWKDFRNGQRCALCRGNAKLTHEYVEGQFKLAGYKMLSEYVNSGTPILFRCGQNHTHQLSWDSFNQGNRCGFCSGRYSVTYDRVKSEFEAIGYEVLSSAYVNNSTPIEYKCDRGHVRKITFSSFQLGNRCSACAGNEKHSHEFVKAQFELAGYEMLSEYVNSKTPILFRCGRGHTHQILWNNFYRGKRCVYCAGQVVTNEHVRSQFESVGYQLLSEYVNAKKKLKFSCQKNHLNEITWNKFQQGGRCQTCSSMEPRKTKHDLVFVKAQFSSVGYKMLGDYINNITPITFRCDKGHVHQIRLSELQKGCRCGVCRGSKKHTHEFIESQFELYGYQLLSEYVNSKAPLVFCCNKNHIGRISWAHFQAGVRCGTCHTEDFYKIYSNRAASRIIRSIGLEIQRQRKSVTWSHFYTKDKIKMISESIKNVYNSCPKGHAVDHIVPITAFNLLKEDELVACWSFGNLRYLEAIDNIKRQNKMTLEEIEYIKLSYPEIIDAASRLNSIPRANP